MTDTAGERSLAVIAVPGDRDVDLKRTEAVLNPALVEPATAADLAKHTKLVPGYIGPGYGDEDVPHYFDPRIVPGTRWITGANATDKHVFDLVAGRDFEVSDTIEAAEVRAGDPAPDGSGPLELARGVEIGHIFQLGTKYAKALGLSVLDENGKARVVTMGSYGLGITRVLAVLAELNNDELGLKWPAHVAPYHVHVVATGKDDAVFVASEGIAEALEALGVEVCYDDRRGASPGVKFKDAELLGAPFIVVVGKGLEAGTVEIRDRRAGTTDEVPLAEAVDADGGARRGGDQRLAAGFDRRATRREGRRRGEGPRPRASRRATAGFARERRRPPTGATRDPRDPRGRGQPP